MSRLIVGQPTRVLQTFHVAAARGAGFAQLVSALGEVGFPLEPVRSAAFSARLGDADVVDAATRLALTRTLAPSDERRALDIFQATRMRFDDTNARAAGIVAPTPSPERLRTMVRRMLGGESPSPRHP